MSFLDAFIADEYEIGYFQTIVTTPDGRKADITMFRGVPTQVSALSSADPFGDSVGSLTLPSVSPLDCPGQGELFWLVPYASVDIRWVQPDGSMDSSWIWEGLIMSYDIELGEDGTNCNIDLKGALFQLDNYLAFPSFPAQPVPYELILRNVFDPVQHPGLKTHPLILNFPNGWNTTVPVFDTNPAHWYLNPFGVRPGQQWTGLTSRTTGAFGPALQYAQELLSGMYSDLGQWTILKNSGRVPVLQVRTLKLLEDETTLVVSVGQPGVLFTVSRDYTQSASVIYGTGKDLAGVSFSNQRVSNDGLTTFYSPYAYQPQTYPATTDNPNYEPWYPRKEAYLQFTPGLDEPAAAQVAIQQLRRFADPGLTGNITLSSDPSVNGKTYPRHLIKAGGTILLKGLFGNASGMMFHITEASIDLNEGSTTLTVDSKFRDQLTVDEVRARTRDALIPTRALQVGQVSPLIEDSVKPWSYAQGSGIIPSGGGYDATEFFNKIMDPKSIFPWTEWTTKYPPKNSSYRKYYLPLGPKSTNPANSTPNWVAISRNGSSGWGLPIKAAQAGSIRLIQIAAYDANGNVLPIRFHVSIYNTTINIDSMPLIPAGFKAAYSLPYNDAQPYPFFPGAFEKYRADGTLQTNQPGTQVAPEAGFIIGWGNSYQPAGYSPGMATDGAPKTGLLVDEGSWTFDTTNDVSFDPFSVAQTAKNADAGLLHIMVYADDQLTQPVYFLGRLFRQEPGTS